MASKFLVSGFALLALWAALASAQEKVPVTVYFESYCPDSVKFLTKQLYPVYVTPLMNYMNVTLVPYGKAKTIRDSGELKFECHHQEKECKGNKVIACVLHERESTFSEQFKFINCTSSVIAADTKLEEYPIKQCSSSSIKEDKVRECAGGVEGSTYLDIFGNMTTAAFPNGLTNIPLVVFNDKFDDADHKLAVGDFRKALCSKITGTKPAECEKSGTSALQSAILPIIAAVYIISRV